MTLSPFGNLHIWQVDQLKNLPTDKITAFKGSKAQYKKLINEWYQEMQDNIWPIYDSKGKWQGKAAGFADAATKADLEIQLKYLHETKILDEHPKSNENNVHPDNVRNHRWHYRVEDMQQNNEYEKCLPEEIQSFEYLASSSRPARNFQCYSSSISGESFKDWFWSKANDRTPAFLSIKNDFQRPRPWTAAMNYRFDDFVWDKGSSTVHTGIHPAFPSGHCYQGVVNSAFVYMKWKTSPTSITPASKEALQQYAVDFGDRRVFAGVHYLTDNIASWLLALRLLPHMHKGNEMKEFVTTAIQTKSLVYELIQTHFGAKGYEALEPAKDLLDKYIKPISVSK